MDNRIDNLIDEVLRLATNGAPAHEIHAKASEAKEAIINKVADLQRAVNILDGIVPYKAAGMPWELGWVISPRLSTGAPGTQAIADRNRRTLEFAASSLAASGGESVETSAIVDQLRKAGDPSSEKDLATAVGNILTRSGSWRRVAPGEYAPIKENVEG